MALVLYLLSQRHLFKKRVQELVARLAGFTVTKQHSISDSEVVSLNSERVLIRN